MTNNPINEECDSQPQSNVKLRCLNNNYFPRKYVAWEILAMTARFVEVICNFDQVVPDIGRRKNPPLTMVRP